LLSQLLYTEFLALPTSIRGSCNEELNENWLCHHLADRRCAVTLSSWDWNWT
jgi:hypothetical protein